MRLASRQACSAASTQRASLSACTCSACPLLLQTNSLPTKLKRKTVFFLKLACVPLIKEDIQRLVGAARRVGVQAYPAEPGLPWCTVHCGIRGSSSNTRCLVTYMRCAAFAGGGRRAE